ncbi:MAG: vWA domain-containing protein [Anaerolineae bacterium]
MIVRGGSHSTGMLSGRTWRMALLAAAAALTVGALLLSGAVGLRALESPAAPSDHARAPALADDVLALALPAQAGESECVVTHTKTAAPELLGIGEPVSITLHARAQCPEVPIHYVLVLQGSESVAGSVGRQIESAALQTIDALDLPEHPSTRVAVVGVNDDARLLCRLTNNVSSLGSCVRRLDDEGGLALEKGIEEGMRELQRGRGDVNADLLGEYMIVMTDGKNTEDCNRAVAAANDVKQRGVLLVSVCAGPDCESRCVRQLASSPYLYFDSLSDYVSALEPLLDYMLRGTSPIRELAITDLFPDSMQIVPGSAAPEPVELNVAAGAVTWLAEYPPAAGITVAVGAAPLEPGYLATNLSATGVLTDVWGLTKTFTFDVPWVTVEGPATPSVTPSVTTTPTLTPTRPPVTPATATPTMSPTPTEEATPGDGAPLFIPWCEK